MRRSKTILILELSLTTRRPRNRNNTYGVKALSDAIYTTALDDFYKPGGCQDQVLACANQTVEDRESNPIICRNATNFCRNNVEGPYYTYGGRGVYGQDHLPVELVDARTLTACPQISDTLSMIPRLRTISSTFSIWHPLKRLLG